MKKILLAAALAFSLAGCATIKTDWNIITGATVSPTQIIVTANAFDAAEASATQYLLYCKATVPAPSYCALQTRKTVVAAVRAGIVARNQLEPYITSGTAGPLAIYNTLLATVASLQSSIPATGAAK